MQVPEIFSIRVVRGKGDLPCPVTILLPGDPEPNSPAPDTLYIAVVFPDSAERYTAFGRFIDQWGNLELLLELAHNLLGSDRGTTQIVTATLGTKDTTDLIRNLAAARLTEDKISRLDSLLDRLGKAATKRNYLIHGRWVYEVFIYVTGGEVIHVKPQFLREYTPPNPQIASKIANPINQKERVKYSFTLKRIVGAVADNMKLQMDFAAFTKTL